MLWFVFGLMLGTIARAVGSGRHPPENMGTLLHPKRDILETETEGLGPEDTFENT